MYEHERIASQQKTSIPPIFGFTTLLLTVLLFVCTLGAHKTLLLCIAWLGSFKLHLDTQATRLVLRA